jgi:glycosyltransferase involved in cell wall biosynthesis
MKEEFFSVLIPVYNTEKYLEECIESVLNQKYKYFEIILIDDGSTDLSGIICDKYAEQNRQIKVYHQKNNGPLIARRYAISKANGNFYLFLDSDDYWDKNLLETVNKIIYEYDCDLVIFNHRRVSESGIYLSDGVTIFDDRTVFNHDNKNIIFKKIISSSNLNNLAFEVVKRDIVDEGDYYKYGKIKNGNDLLQSLPFVYNAKKIVYINKILYNYRQISDKVAKKVNINFFEDVSTVRYILLKYIRKLKLDDNNNLESFYKFYLKIISKNINNLINNRITKVEKIETLKRLKSIHLYLKARDYINIYKLSLDHIVRFYFLDKNYYELIFVYEKIIYFLKKIKQFLKKIFRIYIQK